MRTPPYSYPRTLRLAQGGRRACLRRALPGSPATWACCPSPQPPTCDYCGQERPWRDVAGLTVRAQCECEGAVAAREERRKLDEERWEIRRQEAEAERR